MKLKTPLIAAAMTCAMAISAPAKAVVIADIVFLIDNSASMGGEIADVKARIGDFNTAMTNAGIDANYGLVRVGGPNPGGHFLQDLVDFATFTMAGSPFQTLSANAGNPEAGSVAVNVALSQTTFRANSVKNLILITDEDDDSSVAAFNQADSGLGAANALFNYIGALNAGNTQQRYQVLADNHGGIGFDISQFQNPQTADAFFINFTNTKVQEIISQPPNGVPEPGTLALFGIGIAGLGFLRRRKAA